MDPNSLLKKVKNKSFLGAFFLGGGAKDMMTPFLGFGGGAWPGWSPWIRQWEQVTWQATLPTSDLLVTLPSDFARFWGVFEVTCR